MKKKLLAGVLAIAMAAALVGINSTSVSAQPLSQTFSIMVHFEYANGFNYDYPLARGVEASDVSTILQACGKAHQAPSVVWFHCFVIPE